jgi:ATP-dependent Clp protease adaptor protein ClpS
MTTTSTAPGTRPATNPDTGDDSRLLQPWNVVLLDDQDHSYAYVIDLLGRVFGHSRRSAFELARTVDTQGRAVVATVHRELGELRVQQIAGFGADPLLWQSRGSMHALLEPAGGSDDDKQ